MPPYYLRVPKNTIALENSLLVIITTNFHDKLADEVPLRTWTVR